MATLHYVIHLFLTTTVVEQQRVIREMALKVIFIIGKKFNGTSASKKYEESWSVLTKEWIHNVQ